MKNLLSNMLGLVAVVALFGTLSSGAAFADDGWSWNHRSDGQRYERRYEGERRYERERERDREWRERRERERERRERERHERWEREHRGRPGIILHWPL